ncbi:hypothetical protein MAXJ12_33329 [Mesorhizobium alhagi CCNWXJ12-2]|jgi:hypothetical protein|uniref:Uncharacterized protein n=1 Tax=Mesorhizobium alhagi CCNWXJ12-2 TaxID=1107882 RepID=H0I2G2_9HYPH|nr:hypothetical protein MAXJ12_33329 [Mesorhizobium alhagi CCNWXJ12-2]
MPLFQVIAQSKLHIQMGRDQEPVLQVEHAEHPVL